jgi:hypothetical protein
MRRFSQFRFDFIVGLCVCLLLISTPSFAQRGPEQTLETAPDLAAWVEQLKAPPVSARSARRLAKVYEHCGLFAGPKTRSEWMALFMPSIKADELFRKQRIALAEAGYRRCEHLVAGGADVYGERERWIKYAAAQGDLVAKLILRQNKTPTAADIKAFESELTLALNSKDPEAIWEAARSLRMAGFDWNTISSTPWPDKPLDALRAVFQLAACDLGYACGADSELIKAFCIRGTCAPKSYAQWLPTFLSAEQNALVQAQLPKVLPLLKAGRGAELIFK